MNIDQARQSSCHLRQALLLPATRLWLGACLSLLLGFVSACGNKGDLYLEPDDESLKELEQAEEEIEQVFQLPDDTAEPTIPADQDEEGADENEDEPKKKPAS